MSRSLAVHFFQPLGFVGGLHQFIAFDARNIRIRRSGPALMGAVVAMRLGDAPFT